MFFSALTWLKSYIEEDDGVTAIEYGLIAALIAIAAITAMTRLGGELTNTFSKVDKTLKTANA